jgi:hypothetical protein
VVTAAAIDDGARVVVLGDSAGHVRVFDVSAGIDVSSPEAAAASFVEVRVCVEGGEPGRLSGSASLTSARAAAWLRVCVGLQRAHWQAHDGAVASVDIIPARNSSSSSSSNRRVDGSSSNAPDPAAADSSSSVQPGQQQEPLVLSGARDCNVAVWTLAGGLVGRLGEHAWDLDDPGTWQDPAGLLRRPPKQEDVDPAVKVRGQRLGVRAEGVSGCMCFSVRGVDGSVRDEDGGVPESD